MMKNDGRNKRQGTGSNPRGKKNPTRSTTQDDRQKSGFKKDDGDGFQSKAIKRYSKGKETHGNRFLSVKRKPLPEEKPGVRLNKYLANAGIASRREADALIKAGVVEINGKVVTEMGVRVMPGDTVRYGGESLRSEKIVYIVMNKPKDVITTVDDEKGRKTVLDIVRKDCKERVYPVGRLDRQTTGVLLLTNDGDLTKKLLHPSFEMKKIYKATVDKALAKGDLMKLLKGVELEDGIAKADKAEFVEGERTEIGIEIHSGKNRIIRRMFEALDYKVVKLDRVYFAGLTKRGLARGHYRYLTPKEVAMLKMNPQ